jgi:hypothetical protein
LLGCFIKRRVGGLYRKSHKTNNLPGTPSAVGEVIIWIVKLGCNIGRREDPPPDMISLWRVGSV